MNRLTILFVLASMLLISPYALSKAAGNKHPSGFSILKSDFSSGTINEEDLLTQKFYYIFNRKKINGRYRTESDRPLSCATPVIIEYEKNEKDLSISKRNELSSYLNLNSTESTSSLIYISPSGIFQLNYDTVGVNSVPLFDNNANGIPDYIERIAEYCDYSWHLLIDSLGYLPPDTAQRRYQVGFQKMFASGYTLNDQYNKNFTKMVLNNDLVQFAKDYGNPKDTMGVAEVTVAHELKHAVQYTYTRWSDRQWFLEMDAVWTEDLAYDDVNNYYSFLTTSQITEPGSSFSNGMGYGNCIWMHFLTQSYGTQINKEIWEISSSEKSTSFTDSTEYHIFKEALTKYGTMLDSAVTEYFIWNYFSGRNATPLIRSYKEAASYPDPAIYSLIKTLPFSGQGDTRQKLSANFIKVQSDGENVPYEIKIRFENSQNKVALIEKYGSGDIKIRYLEQVDSAVDYVSDVPLKNIKEMILIPVAISSSTGNYNYTYQITPVKVGTDTVKPVISVDYSVNELSSQSFPYKVTADISDESGIDSAYIEYKFDDGSLKNCKMEKLNDNTYCGYINIDSNEVEELKELNFRVAAVNSGTRQNTGFYPAAGYINLKIAQQSQVTSVDQSGGEINTDSGFLKIIPTRLIRLQ